MSQDLTQSGGHSNSQLRVDSGRLIGKGGNPFENLLLLTDKDKIPFIMKDGANYKNAL